MEVNDIIQENKIKHRICPMPQKWNDLWQMLPARERNGNGCIPPLPLILGAWHYTSNKEKELRFYEHLYWASDQGSLDKIIEYLNSLQEKDWYHEGE